MILAGTCVLCMLLVGTCVLFHWSAQACCFAGRPMRAMLTECSSLMPSLALCYWSARVCCVTTQCTWHGTHLHLRAALTCGDGANLRAAVTFRHMSAIFSHHVAGRHVLGVLMVGLACYSSGCAGRVTHPHLHAVELVGTCATISVGTCEPFDSLAHVCLVDGQHVRTVSLVGTCMP